jgi:hypothetical protein
MGNPRRKVITLGILSKEVCLVRHFGKYFLATPTILELSYTRISQTYLKLRSSYYIKLLRSRVVNNVQ